MVREKNKWIIFVVMCEVYFVMKMIVEMVDKKARVARERGGFVIESVVFGVFDL